MLRVSVISLFRLRLLFVQNHRQNNKQQTNCAKYDRFDHKPLKRSLQQTGDRRVYDRLLDGKSRDRIRSKNVRTRCRQQCSRSE